MGDWQWTVDSDINLPDWWQPSQQDMSVSSRSCLRTLPFQ